MWSAQTDNGTVVVTRRSPSPFLIPTGGQSPLSRLVDGFHLLLLILMIIKYVTRHVRLPADTVTQRRSIQANSFAPGDTPLRPQLYFLIESLIFSSTLRMAREVLSISSRRRLTSDRISATCNRYPLPLSPPGTTCNFSEDGLWSSSILCSTVSTFFWLSAACSSFC